MTLSIKLLYLLGIKRDSCDSATEKLRNFYTQDLQADRSRQRRGRGVCLAWRYLSTSVADVTLSRADFCAMRKPKEKKSKPRKIQHENDECCCLLNGVFFSHCLRSGGCFGLKSRNHFKFFRKEKWRIRKVIQAIRKENLFLFNKYL